jgi:hypothetical protein
LYLRHPNGVTHPAWKSGELISELGQTYAVNDS